MKKVIYNLGFFALMGAGVLVNAQENTGRVGINVGETPQATLDVQPTTANLKGTTNEGFIAPKLTKERVANIAIPVEGTLVYVENVAYTGNKAAVAKIDSKGYYYFDGTEWVKAKGAEVQTIGATNGLSKDGDNIELGGALTKNTDIALNGNNLTTSGNGNVGIGTDNPTEKLEVIGGIGSTLSTNEGGYLELKNPTKEEKGTAYKWRVYNMTGGYGNSLQFWGYEKDGTRLGSKVTITDAGNVGIGVQSPDSPTAKLDVNGNARIRTIEEGNPGTDYVVLADKKGNIKKAAVGSLGKSYEGSTSIVLNKNSFERAALIGDVTSAQNSNEVTVNAIQGKSISNTAPTNGQVLKWNETNSKWEPSTDDSGVILTANNGLTKNIDNNIELGGTLTKATNIDQAGKNLTTTGKGNVGIGTDNPTEKLEVIGGIGSTLSANEGGYLELKNPTKEEKGTAYKWRVYNMTGDYGNSLQFWGYGKDGTRLGSKVTITDAGNVGIGVQSPDSPTAKLDVNGNARIRTIADGNPDTDYVVLADTYGNIKKANVTSFKGPKGDTGETGAQGPAGAAGPQGPSGVVAGANGITYEESSKTVSLPQGADGQVLKWENNTWTPANVNTKNLYTDNGTLTENRTVTQNNNNLTFSTGTTGKFILEGNTKIASTVSVAPNTEGVPASQLDANGLAKTAAAGRTIRVYDGSGVPDYQPTDYMIVLTNPNVNTKLQLPSAKDNPGRIIYLLNGCTQGLGFSNTETDDVYPFNFGTIAVSAGVGFVSTGKTWYVIGR